MPILSAEELASHRAELLSNLTDTCTIQRATETNSGSGVTQAFNPLATGVACRFAPDTGDEKIVGNAVRGYMRGIFTFVHTQDIKAKDRVIWNGRTFEVSTVRPRTNAISLRVEVVEVK